MEYEEVLRQIITIATSHFANEHHKIGAGTTASDILTWNSLNHVMLMANIERAFKIKFDLLQMIEMKSIEDIAKATHDMLK